MNKIYIYKVFENELADPFMSRFYWHVNKKLNLEDIICDEELANIKCKTYFRYSDFWTYTESF